MTNEKISSLAEYLGIDVDAVKQSTYDPNLFEIDESGEEYLVLTEDEAHEYAEDDIKNIFDDMGLDAFTPQFQKWICENAVDEDFFDEVLREDCDNLVAEYREEDPYDREEFANRLIELAYEAEIITDANFLENEDGSINYSEIDESVMSMVEIEEKYADYLYDEEDDPIQWFINIFGNEEVSRAIENGNASIDMDAVVEECINEDGIAHFISRYDGREIDLEDGFYAYRQN